MHGLVTLSVSKVLEEVNYQNKYFQFIIEIEFWSASLCRAWPHSTNSKNLTK